MDRENADDIRTGLILDSIQFVLLHEFAHHLHKDVFTVLTEKSRQQESNADNYAFQTMLGSAEHSPLVVGPVIILFCSVENFNTNDRALDHPAGVRRLKAMIAAGKSSERWTKMWKLATPEQRQQIQVALDQLEAIGPP